jgi:hypothetical protein
MSKYISFEKAMRIFLGQDFDSNYNKDEPDCLYFCCPECTDPIYRDDYPKLEVSGGVLICPICGSELE